MTALSDRGIAVIDCMVNVDPDGGLNIGHIPRQAFRDEASLEAWPGTGIVGYLFKGAEERIAESSDARRVVGLLDRYGIERAGVLVQSDDPARTIEALEAAGDRWFFTVRVDPHDGMAALRRMEALARAHPNVKGVTVSPHALYPTIPPSSKEFYPVYAKCIELDLPISITVGIPGPRVPGLTQDPGHLDEVCWFFPELKVVMKHGGEPWTDMCVKLMLKWPNLYFTTSGFAPRYWPEAIIEYANTRGAEKIIYSGYYPLLSFDDIFGQIAKLQLRDHVWPKMFRENARRLYKLP